MEVIDELEARIRLREYDIIERYGPDEFRGVLAHLKEISIADVEKVIRRLMQNGEFSKPKGLLYPIQSLKDLRKEVLGLTKRLLHGGIGRRREDALDLREEGSMPLSCEEYRQQQQLLALKKRLAEDKLKPEDREELERLIQEIERRLKI